MTDHKTPHQLEREHIQELAKIKAEERIALMQVKHVKASTAPARYTVYAYGLTQVMSISAGVAILLIIAQYKLDWWLTPLALIFTLFTTPGKLSVSQDAKTQGESHEDR